MGANLHRVDKDPMALGDPKADRGSEEWARWRRTEFQSLVDRMDFAPDMIWTETQMFHEMRLWTMLTDLFGQPFATFRAFVEHPKPHGLETEYRRLVGVLRAHVGDAAVELLEVPASRQGERSDLVDGLSHGVTNTSGHRDPKLAGRKQKRLKAILRAPSEIQDLYRQGNISQKWAAKLGPYKPEPETAARIREITNAITKLGDRKAIDAAVKEMLGCEEDPLLRIPAEVSKAADRLIEKLEAEFLRQLIAELAARLGGVQ